MGLIHLRDEMAIYLLPSGELSQKYLKTTSKHLVGLFIDMKKLRRLANEIPGYGGVGTERRNEGKEGAGLQQSINLILRGDQRAESEKKEKVTPELIALIMNNPDLMASLNKQNARNFMSQPK